jgi:heat shock protein HslJ
MLIATSFLLGCSDKGAELLSAIDNSSWSLQRIETVGSEPDIIPPSESYVLEFRTSNQVGGVSHCNTWQATYSIPSPGVISFSKMTWTEIACRPPTHDGEFQRALGESSSIQIVRDELRLYNSTKTRLLSFVRIQ